MPNMGEHVNAQSIPLPSLLSGKHPSITMNLVRSEGDIILSR
jgi:hypothetical protein